MLKKALKKACTNIYETRNRIKYRTDMQKKLNSAEIPINELSTYERAEISEYWKKFGLKPDFNTFKWYYSVNGEKNPRYISEDIYTNYIWTKLNDMKRCKGINDKNMLDIFYAGFNMPETVFHNIHGIFLDKNYKMITREKGILLASECDKVVIKAAVDSCQGNDVVCVKGNECKKIIDRFGKDYIVQKVVKQHSTFAKLNESSVNVIRMTSLLLNGEVYILDSIIRVGAPGNFTDHKNVAIGIDENGLLRDFGVTVKGRKVTKLPNGFAFGGGYKLAGYREMVSLVKDLHTRTPQARLIGWDLTADEEGHPLIIEANMEFPGIGRGQDCNGPFFGELTDEVLKFVLQM